MPRQSDPIDDRTPLDGPRIDVAARVGWLLRTHRTVAGVSLRQMSEALADRGLRISAATLSRVESEGQRSGTAIDGYAAVLGLPDGALRADIDGICRSFPYSPARVPEPLGATLEPFSRAYDEVTVDRPTAGAWHRFARMHAHRAGLGLPLALMEPLVGRLADEIGRGVTHSRLTRHDALNELAGSPYGPLTLATLCRRVEDPDHQSFYDLTSVLSNYPSPQLTAWAGRLLRSPSLFHVRGASYTLQGMLVRGGLPLDAWRSLALPIREAQAAARGDTDKTAAVDDLVAALPPSLHADLRASGVRPPAKKAVVTPSRTRNNPHYLTAAAIAQAACADLRHPEEPLLERLVFEACFESRGVRMSTATWTVMASPFGTAVARAILRQTVWPEDGCRGAAMRVAAFCNGVQPLAGVEDLLDEESLFVSAATIIGRSGGRLPDDALARGLAGDETMVRQTLYALGMAGDPRLTALAEEGAQPPAITRAARWWLARGGRVLV